jgi:hypothetical protein
MYPKDDVINKVMNTSCQLSRLRQAIQHGDRLNQENCDEILCTTLNLLKWFMKYHLLDNEEE